MQYEDFKLIVKYRGVGNVSEHVYNLVKKHHSVRKFKNKPLSEDVVKKLVEAGQSWTKRFDVKFPASILNYWYRR